MKISLIAAVSINGVIGHQGMLPWHFPSDLKYFRDTTANSTIIMGRKTFESLGKSLPQRQNIVVTRNAQFKAPGALVVESINQALQLCEYEEAFIIGGAEIYKVVLPFVNKIYLTFIGKVYEGDTFLPDINWKDFVVTHTESIQESDVLLTFLEASRIDNFK